MPPQSGRIRVLIVDAIAETRENLAKLLYFERNIEVTGLAGSSIEAIIQVRQHRPDVVLLDLTLPNNESMRTIEALSSDIGMPRFILLSREGSTHFFPAGLPPMLRGLLVKPVRADELVQLIHASCRS